MHHRVSADRHETAAEAAAALIRFSACEKVICWGNCVAACFEQSQQRRQAPRSKRSFCWQAIRVPQGKTWTICRECSIEIVPLDKSTIGVVAINRIA
jgi:hypothetical protein